MLFGLSNHTIRQIKGVFEKYPSIHEVKIYGSRTQENYRKGSDIDLAFFSESEEDLSSNLSWDLDELPTPYMFDVVNYNKLDNENPLKEEIDKYGKIFYTKKHTPSKKNPSSTRKTSSSKHVSSPQVRHPRESGDPPHVRRDSRLHGNDVTPPSSPQDVSFPKDTSSLRDTSFLRKQESSKEKTSEIKKLFATKQTEIGKIPEHWRLLQLDKICTLEYGKPLKKSDRQNGHYPIFGSNGVVGYHNEYLIKGPCIIVGRKGTAGEVTYSEDSCFPIDTTFFVQLKNNSKCNLKYLYFIMKVLNLKQLITKSNVPGLNRNDAYKVLVPFPSFSEQEKISGVLSQIQKAIQVQDKLIEITEELKKSTMKQLFTYGIRGEKTKQTEIGELPESWAVCTIEKLFQLRQGKSLSSKNQTGLYLKPFLRTSNVFWGCLDLEKVDEMDILDKERKSLMLKKGDLLICEGGDIGRTAIWNEEIKECYYQNHIHRLRAKKEKDIFPWFYMYWMNAGVRMLNIYGTFGNRTTIPNLSGKRLLQFKIPYPPLSEQKEIVDILVKVDSKIQTYKKKKSILEELFKTMLHKLMTGKIRVHHLDINTKLLGQ